jgi:hypothetical protein
VWRTLPEFGSTSTTELSLDPDASTLPSGVRKGYAVAIIGVVLERVEDVARLWVDQHNRLVFRPGRREHAAVGGKGYACDPTGVVLELVEDVARLWVDQHHRLVLRPRREHAAVGGKGKTNDIIGVVLELAHHIHRAKFSSPFPAVA